MRYLQHKGGQKLHLVFEIDNGLTHPICGRKFDSYRANFNIPMGHACKNCLRVFKSKSFNPNEFMIKHLRES